jgi:hypothetical protein
MLAWLLLLVAGRSSLELHRWCFPLHREICALDRQTMADLVRDGLQK